MSIKWKKIKEFTDIKYESGIDKASGIAKITINRPEVRNAFRPQTVFELKEAFTLAREDQNIGVIILTAYGSKDIVIESLEYKADAYIEKPIDFWLLRDKMEMVLKRTHYFRDDHSISQKVGVTQQTLEDQVNKRVTLRELSKKGVSVRI